MLRCAVALLVLACPLLAGCKEATGPEREISGKQLYDQYCARCHGLDGSGIGDDEGRQAKPLNDPRVMAQLSDEAIKGVIMAGRPGGPGQPPLMPAFGDVFTEARLMVLVAYVRSLSQPETKAPGGDED